MNKLTSSSLISFCLIFASCAKNVSDVVAPHDRTLGVFEPAQDYLVDVPLQSRMVSGNSKGTVILGFITLGGSETSEGVALSSRGESTLNGGSTGSVGGGSGIAGAVSGAIGSVGAVIAPVAKLIPESPRERFKKAALRNACDLNSCDVVGYPMYNVDEKNYFLWKNYKVSVKGFPGNIKGVENVGRQYSPNKDTYWRKGAPASRPFSSIESNDLSYPRSEYQQTLDRIERRLGGLSSQLDELDQSASSRTPSSQL
tara:strand:- start:267 stop:1034 length:768 start_codon:yes stop_codon:yes gene_type:complete